MKKFDVEFTYTSDGVITIEAKNADEAMAKAKEILANGLPHIDVYYTDGRGSVELIDEVDDENIEE